jgi:hypothetical protein
MLQLVLEGGSLVRPLHILSPVHWVGVEPTTLRDETSGRTTTPVELSIAYQIEEHTENDLTLKKLKYTAKTTTHVTTDIGPQIQTITSFYENPEIHHKQLKFTNASLSTQLHLTPSIKKHKPDTNSSSYRHLTPKQTEDETNTYIKSNKKMVSQDTSNNSITTTKQWVNDKKSQYNLKQSKNNYKSTKKGP